jgi:hypothetical protein
MTTYMIESGSGYWFDGQDAEFTWAETDDITYYCSALCLHEDLSTINGVVEPESDDGLWASKAPMRYTDGSPTERYPAVTWGRCGAPETDYDLHCETCSDLMSEGLQTIAEREGFIESAFAAYLTCALWSSMDYAEEDEGNCVPTFATNGATADDIVGADRDYLMSDLEGFVSSEWSKVKDFDPEQVGQDLWLTQNGHGAGFWDGAYPEPIGSQLTAAAKVYGGIDLCRGDDGLIHAS